MGTDPPLEIQGASAASLDTTFGANRIKKHLKNSGASLKCLNNHAAFFGAVGLGSGPHFSDPSGWAGRRRSYMGVSTPCHTLLFTFQSRPGSACVYALGWMAWLQIAKSALELGLLLLKLGFAAVLVNSDAWR